MQIKRCVYFPEIWDDEKELADVLINKRELKVDLKYLNTTLGKRIIDFLCGITYCNEGYIKKIRESKFHIWLPLITKKE